MTREEKFERREQNHRYELLLQIAGIAGLIVAALLFFRFGLFVALGVVLISLVALGVGKLFAVLNALADQVEALEQKLEQREGNNGGR